MNGKTREILGAEADDLLSHECRTISREMLHLPGPVFVDDVVAASDRSPRVLRNLQSLFDHGRLAGTGYMSILPVDQGFEMGAATVYSGSPESRRQIEEISAAFARAHDLGMATVLWAYLRNESLTKDGVSYETSANLTGQANHLAVTLAADIVKQKQPTCNGGYQAVSFGKTSDEVHRKLTSAHPIDWIRYQVVNCHLGRVPLINSGGASGSNDLQQAGGGRRSDHGPQVLPEAHERRRGTAARRAGRVPGSEHHRRVTAEKETKNRYWRAG